MLFSFQAVELGRLSKVVQTRRLPRLPHPSQLSKWIFYPFHFLVGRNGDSVVGPGKVDYIYFELSYGQVIKRKEASGKKRRGFRSFANSNFIIEIIFAHA